MIPHLRLLLDHLGDPGQGSPVSGETGCTRSLEQDLGQLLPLRLRQAEWATGMRLGAEGFDSSLLQRCFPTEYGGGEAGHFAHPCTLLEQPSRHLAAHFQSLCTTF